MASAQQGPAGASDFARHEPGGADPAAVPRSSKTQVLWQVARGALSIAAIIYLARKYDLWNSLRTLAGANPLYVLAGTLVLSSQVVIAGLRWSCVLHRLGAAIPLAKTIRLSYVASFFNSCLPTGIAGDVARAWFARDDQTRLATAVSSVFLDRVAATLALLLLAAAAEPFVWRQLAASTELAPVIVLFAACGLAGTFALVVADRFTPLLRPLRLPLVNSLAATVNKLSADARRAFRFGPSLAALFACAFGGNLAICFSVYIYAVGLGVDLGLAQWLLVVPLVLLLMALPISLGGWGAREFAMVYLLDLFGVAHADALTVSIGFGLGSMLASLPGAWFWMTLRRARINR